MPNLPDLPPLAGKWDYDTFDLFTNTDGWVQIASADPRRWAVVIQTNQAGPQWVSDTPENIVMAGIPIALNVPNELLYNKYGSYIQRQLYFVTSNPIERCWGINIYMIPRR